MGKRNVIIELESLCQLSQYILISNICPRVMDHLSALSEPATHERRLGITSNMMVDWFARQLNSMTSWIIVDGLWPGTSYICRMH